MNDASQVAVRHYAWAGLDFMLDSDGRPVLLEANRASHMLPEYLHFLGNERPFELVAEMMNRCDGPPCLLWRRDERPPSAQEDACFIGGYLAKYLNRPPVICNVEENQQPTGSLIARGGGRVRPGSLFRWWYGLPTAVERAGALVINPNCAWMVVRDKLACYAAVDAETIGSSTIGTARAGTAPGGAPPGPRHFRVPRAFAVNKAQEARRLLNEHPSLFAGGFVLKPRVGWGGQGVQIGDAGTPIEPFEGRYLLSQRVTPELMQGRFWEARVFVMAGHYLGGICHASGTPQTNYYRGGRPLALDPAVCAILRPAALEAVALIDQAAEQVRAAGVPDDSPLLRVIY